MTPELWARVKSTFDDLSDSTAEHRGDVLTTLDPDLRSEVERLLSEYDRSKGDGFNNLRVDAGADLLSAILGDLRTFEQGDVLQNRFEIRAFIGSGGMGEVYEAYDPNLGEIAIKTVRFDLLSNGAIVERFRREVQRARMVSHVNVCRVYEWFDETMSDGTTAPFATMELLRGPTLYAAVKQRGAFPAAEALAVAIPLCAGMAAAHDADVIHRDFKSANVMLTTQASGSLRPVIMDFGLARVVSHEPAAQTSFEGGIAGTKAYLAPELIHGDPATKASDIYALGVVLFRLCTGRYPFEPDLDWRTALEVRKDPPRVQDFERALSAEWRNAVSSCLKFDPATRPASALDVAAMLTGTSAPSQQPGGLARRRVIGGLILSVAAAGAVDMWRRRPIAPVENTPGPLRVLVEEFDSSDAGGALGRAVRNLFRVTLGTSRSTRTLSQQEVRRAIESLGIGAVPLRGRDALAVAKRAGASILVGGSIRPENDGYRLTTRVVDADSGREIRRDEQHVQGRFNLPTLVESVARRLRLTPVGETAAAQMGRAPLEQADTDVPDALEQFTAGLQYYYEGDTKVAHAHMQEAIRLDPNFAIAHVYDATMHCAFRRDDLAMEPAARAYALRHKVNARHRNHAEALFYIVHGDFERAHERFRVLAGLYPQEAQLQRHLAQSYAHFENADAELEHARRAVELDPANALNQNLYIGSLAENGRFDEAVKSLTEAQRLLPGNAVLRYSEAYVCLLRSNVDGAVDCARDAGRNADLASLARQLEMKALILAGRFGEARHRMEVDLDVSRVADDRSTVDTYHYWLGQIVGLHGDRKGVARHSAALAGREAAPPNLSVLRHAAELGWRSGSIDLLEEIVNKLRRIAGVHDSTRAQGMLHYAQGLLASTRSPGAGRDLLAKACAFWPDVNGRFALGQVALRDGAYEQAHAALREVTRAKPWALRTDGVFLWVSSLTLAAGCAAKLGKMTEAAEYAKLFGQHWGAQQAPTFADRNESPTGD